MGRARLILTSVLMLIAIGSIGRGDEPATKPSAGAKPATEFVVTPMRVQELKGVDTFVYAEAQTTLADLKQTIARVMTPVNEAIKAGKFQPDGPMIFIYSGLQQDMSEPFTLQIGMPARGEAQAGGDIKVRKLDPLRAATIVYSGPVVDLAKPYQQLFSDLFADGLAPTGESREIYTYWEGEGSPNNVVVIQVGVK